MARKYFGTDGIRGLTNVQPMTAEMAMKVGMAAGADPPRDRMFRIKRQGRGRCWAAEQARLASFGAGQQPARKRLLQSPTIFFYVQACLFSSEAYANLIATELYKQTVSFQTEITLPFGNVGATPRGIQMVTRRPGLASSRVSRPP